MANFLSDIISRVQNFMDNGQQQLISPVPKPNLDDMISQRRRAGTLNTLNMPQQMTPQNTQNKVFMPTQVTPQTAPQRTLDMGNLDKVKQFLSIMQQPQQAPQQQRSFNITQPEVAGAQTSPTVAPTATPLPAILKRYGIPSDLSDPILNVHDGWSYPQVKGNPGIQLDPAFQKILEEKIFPITDQAGIPRALVAGQVAIETGNGTSNLARNQNNYFGLLNSAMKQFYSFDDPSKGAEMYAYTMTKGNFRDRQNKDAIKYLYNLQNAKAPRYEGHSEKPYEYLTLVTGTPAFQKYYTGGE